MKKQIANKNSTSKNQVPVKKAQDETGPKKSKIPALTNNLTHRACKAMRKALPNRIDKCMNKIDNCRVS